MPARDDAFGQIMFDYLMGKEKVVEIIERDDGYIDVSSGPQVYFSHYDDWSTHLQQAMSFVRGRVLDIGCGAGRHTLYLQENGHEVVAIDKSPLAVEVCRRRGVRDARLLSITGVSSRLGQFDSLLMLGNNFGLMGNARRARWLLRRFYKMTPANGRLIVESNEIGQTTNPLHQAYHEWNRQRGRLPGQLRLRVRYRKLKGEWFDYLLVTREEMAEILAGTGWHIAQTLLHETLPMYVAIIEKE